MNSNEKVQKICKILSDKKATDIVIADVGGISDVAEYFVICSGRSTPLVKALFRYLEEGMEKDGEIALRSEGVREGRWIAVDYGDVLVHLFHAEAREFYQLDKLWNNGTNVSYYTEPKKTRAAGVRTKKANTAEPMRTENE